jgi:hypothetical protein
VPGLSVGDPRSALRHPLLRDAAIVLAWFAVVGMIGALLWWQLTPLAEFTRTDTTAQMNEAELGRQVATDGWYVAIAAVGGLLSGIALLGLRRRDPLAMVVLVAVGGLLAAWLMVRIGLWLGPADPKTVLRDVAVGDKVPLQLKPHAGDVRFNLGTGRDYLVPVVAFVWPIAALVGAIGVIWGLDEHRPSADESSLRNDQLSAKHSG